MGKLMQLALVAGIGYVAWKFFEIKDAVSGLQYKITGVHVDTANISQTQLQTTLSIYNPSAVNLKFQNFTGMIYNQGTPVAAVAISQPVAIAPNGITQVPMAVTVENVNALPIVDNILSGDLSGLNLSGTVTISMIPVPVNINLG